MARTLQQTRDSIGSSDQTKDQLFIGGIKEKARIRVVQEIIRVQEFDGPLWDDDGSRWDQDEVWDSTTTYQVEDQVRRLRSWKGYHDLVNAPTSTGTLAEGGVEVNLTEVA